MNGRVVRCVFHAKPEDAATLYIAADGSFWCPSCRKMGKVKSYPELKFACEKCSGIATSDPFENMGKPCPPTCTNFVEPAFKNRHLSVSRLKKYEGCAYDFYLRYVMGYKTTEFSVAPAFGTLLHETMERLFKWIQEEEFSGALPESKMLEFYREAWQQSGLTGIEIYQEGLFILRTYARNHPEVDHFRIIAVEHEFNIELEEFTVNGKIDRVDRVNDDTIRIVDFKSNRMIFSREEIDVDLQMSVYGLVAKKEWPWAKNIEFVFDMLRHDAKLRTERTDQQLADAADYVVLLGRQTENDPEYRPRINPNCGFCDYRSQCDAYKRAISEKTEMVATGKDLDALAELREKVASIAKAAYGKRRDIDEILKAHIEQSGQLVVDGYRFSLQPKPSYGFASAALERYPVERTLSKAIKLVGISRERATDELVGIDAGKLQEFLKGLPGGRRALLEAELAAIVEKVPGPLEVFVTKLKKKNLKDATLNSEGKLKEPK